MENLTYRKAWDFVKNALVALGMTEKNAYDVAEIYIRAQWNGQGHHDLSYLNQRMNWCNEKLVDIEAEPELIQSSMAFSVYDGNNCLGELGCRRTLEKAMDHAKEYTVGMATIRNTNHFLAGGPYAELAAQKGMIALIFSSTDKTMAGPMGGPAVIGNNPLAMGAPVGDSPFVLDMCMAYASLGTLNKQKKLGHTMENYTGYDKNGQKSGDPGEILEGGSLAPIAHHKGFGLALMVEILTGGINGGAMGLDIPEGGGIGGHSQTIIAFNPGILNGGTEFFAQRFQHMIHGFQGIESEIRYPGSRRSPWNDGNLDESLSLETTVLNQWENWAVKLKIPAL